MKCSLFTIFLGAHFNNDVPKNEESTDENYFPSEIFVEPSEEPIMEGFHST